MADLVGQHLGQYLITGILGEGGMATVYRARQVTVSRDVAVKVIETKLARDPEFVQRFRREAETIAVLDHPHILKLFDFGQQEDLLYLVMELKLGGTLAQRLNHQRLSLDEVERLVAQLTDALDYAHSKGIIHRDLKPHNVLLDERGNAALTDFGIAKVLTGEKTALTQSGVSMGTPHYMAPEQWRGEKADSRTDLYSFGVMLYEMLAGDTPFKADTPSALMYKHLMESVPSLSRQRTDITPPLDAVISRAMAKVPTERFQSGNEIAQAFRNARHGIMPPAEHSAELTNPFAATKRNQNHPVAFDGVKTTIGMTDERPQSPRRSPLPALIGVAALALIGILIVFIGGGGGAQTPTTTPDNTAVVQAPTQTVTLAASDTPALSATPLLPSDTPQPPTLTATFTQRPSDTPVPTLTHTLTNTPTNTLTPSQTATDTATLSATDVEATVLALIATENVAIAQTEQALLTATLLQSTQNARRTAVSLTLTATGWTHTPTPDFQMTASARLTQTRMALLQTETASAWTETPTPTQTPTATFTASATHTPSQTATYTPTPVPTQTPPPTPTYTATPEILPTVSAQTQSSWLPITRLFNGVEMVLVPAGCFQMGSIRATDPQADNDESPASLQLQTICFDVPFWIDKYEVSNKQFKEKRGAAAAFGMWNEDLFPRENVSWRNAREFCEKRGARLPTEPEWEYAVRGPLGLRYPWGTDFIESRVTFARNAGRKPTPIDSHPDGVSWVGAFNMSGNVWEWVSTAYDRYPYNPADGREDLDRIQDRVMRGGSFLDDVSYEGTLRAANRYWATQGFISMNVGFRCARSE